MSYRFNAPLDKLSTWISTILVLFTIVLILIGTLSIFDIITIPSKQPNAHYVPGFILSGAGMLLLLIIVIVYLYKPVYYQVDEEGIYVHRGIGIYTINFQNILRVHKADDFNVFRTLRLFGNGGLFGYTGLFYNTQYGKLRMMATQLKNFIVIYTNNKKVIVITPSDPDGFLESCAKLAITAA